MQRKKAIVMVEPYSTGRHLVEKFDGYALIRVARKNVPECFQGQHDSQTSQFEKTITYHSLNQVLDELKEFDVLHCFAGSEPGVREAGEIAAALKVPTANDIKHLKAWRNKHDMAEALKAANVRSIPHFKSNDINKVITWAKSDESSFVENESPIVIKPLESAGTNDVFICYTEKQIRDAFNKIMTSTNFFQEKNHGVLAQQYIDGPEYAVNAVARDGVIFVTDITQYGKKVKHHSPIYDSEKYLCPVNDEKLFNALTDYLKKVAPALGINHGAIHFEVKRTNDSHSQGAYIAVDIGLRLPGDIDLEAIHDTMGYTQASVLKEALLEPEEFKQRAAAPRIENKKKLWHVFLISEHEGTIINDIRKSFNTVSAYHSSHIDGLGSQLKITRDILTTPGYIVLMGNSESELQTGYTMIRAREKTVLKNCVRTWLQQMSDTASAVIHHPATPYVVVGGLALFALRKTGMTMFSRAYANSGNLTNDILKVFENTRK